MSQSLIDVRKSRQKQDNRTGKRFLTFSVEDELYAVSVYKVSEIIQIQNITRIPRLPAYVKGVINLRGKVIPVIDLRLKFGLEVESYTERNCIVVVNILDEEGTGHLTGLIVDGVDEVVTIAEESVVTAFDLGQNLLAEEFIHGVAKIGDRIATVLEIDRVINHEALLEIQQIKNSSAETPIITEQK